MSSLKTPEYDRFLKEVSEREQELNDLIKKQSEQLNESPKEIKKSNPLISDLTNKIWKSQYTQAQTKLENKRISAIEMVIQTENIEDGRMLSLKPTQTKTN